MDLTPADARVIPDLCAFLSQVDLTTSGLDSPNVRIWVEYDQGGRIIGSTGYELSQDGLDALIRSVAVAPDLRSTGRGTQLAMYALDHAAESGARTAWLFSRRSGPFWEGLGFRRADRTTMAEALATTHQVALFTATGQLEHEVAWSRPLSLR